MEIELLKRHKVENCWIHLRGLKLIRNQDQRNSKDGTRVISDLKLHPLECRISEKILSMIIGWLHSRKWRRRSLMNQ